MGIGALGLPRVRSDRLVDRTLSGQAQGWLDGHLRVLRDVLLALPTFARTRSADGGVVDLIESER